MYKTQCATCGKAGFAYAKDKTGKLPTYYCSKSCETNANYKKRFIER